MSSSPRVLAAALLAVFAISAMPLQAQLLFDGSLNTMPNQQGWAYLTDPIFGASATRSLIVDATLLDTTPAEDDHAGWFANLPPFPAHPQLPLLDRSAGYTLRWTVRLQAESHSSLHRAGLSVIVLSSDLRGVEIGHWSDEVWVQEDSPLFTHGEGASFDTTLARVDYELCVFGDSYRLSADGALLFGGLLRDYSSFGAPYDIPNFLFVGDDTTSAEGRFEWERFEIELEACGCSADTADADGDGTLDCEDDCPDDPLKSSPGACGCGSPDRDVDGDTIPDCDAVLGDFHPDGSGDGIVGLSDFLVAHRKIVLASSPIDARDLEVGDLSPHAFVCERPGAVLRSCAAPDMSLGAEDGALVRALAAGRLEPSCAACTDPPPTGGAARRLPGDAAPRASSGNASTDIGDAILVLRWAVSLDLPLSSEELLRADVAPLVDEEGLQVVRGDGAIDVADVLSILRASVGLATLRWPQREVHADLVDASASLAFSLTVSGWPSWAVSTGVSSAHCPQDGLSGLDAVADHWSLTCASDPALVSGPTRLGSFSYRAPQPVDVTGLAAEATLVDGAFLETPATIELSVD